MSVLHTVNKSPFERNSLDSCLKFAQAGAAVLLIEDGVYAALTGTSVEGRVKEALGAVKIYVLGPDLKARGFSEQRVISGISVVDYAGFVDLAAEHAKVQAWL
jgi:tRNA 2-thiouridine synthesizing protein B